MLKYEEGFQLQELSEKWNGISLSSVLRNHIKVLWVILIIWKFYKCGIYFSCLSVKMYFFCSIFEPTLKRLSNSSTCDIIFNWMQFWNIKFYIWTGVYSKYEYFVLYLKFIQIQRWLKEICKNTCQFTALPVDGCLWSG